MRLLPVRADHGGRRAAPEESEAERRRYRRGDDQHLPLRHLPAHPRGRAQGSRHGQEGLRETTMKNTTRATNLSRRKFIVGSAATGGGLALGFKLPFFGSAEAAEAAGTEVNAWVVVKPDSTCVVRIARSEMGQGTLTGLAQLVAEELECDWKKVATEHVFPGQNLARKRVWGDMATGGSRGIRGSQDYVRRGGAAARIMLVQAAADQWKVPVGELTVSNGVITHPASKRSTTYGKVAVAAAKLTPPDPKTIKLKDPKDWKVAGKPMKRLDTADKLNGSKLYAIDLRMPGMLNAAVMACPVHGGKLVSYDEAKVANMPGVRRVVKVNDGAVAVVADAWWRAKAALQALPIVWDEGANATQSSVTIAERLKEGLTADDAFADTKIGDALKTIASAPKKVEAVYSTPFLSHATMEPMNCTAVVTADKVEVWTATQSAEGSLAAACEEAGLPLEKGEVHKLDLGGGFGRRGGTQDYTRQAVAMAKQFPGVPVKLIWSREEDQAVRQLQGMWKEPGDAQFGYSVPNLQIEYAMRNTHVPVGPWRGVNTNQNGVYLECFMEEVARAAGKDSLEFRRELMANHPKHLGVLNAAAFGRCSTPRGTTIRSPASMRTVRSRNSMSNAPRHTRNISSASACWCQTNGPWKRASFTSWPFSCATRR